MAPFDRYRLTDSPVHRLDPRLKVVLAVLYIASNALLPDGAWLAFGLSWGMVLLAQRLAKFPLLFVVRRSFVALPFALAAVTVMFTLPGDPLATLPLGPWRLTLSDAGVVRFASITLRSWLSVQGAILLTAVTPFPDLMHALRHLRVPGALVAVISFAYRYLFVLAEEARRLLRAREARSARLPGGGGGGSLGWRARVAGNMVGQLFLRSYERSDRVYNAMLARGFRGQFFTLNPHRMQTRDWLTGAAGAGSLLLLQWIARLGG
ncbi:MAG: cobalt ECF transporter T component CbiQ [Caldilineae bacterium]|nr:MAG: cobalt ECF transporter T component CbiQ [Caldilineae bacterium]